ncbi:MAG: hypothetical protein LUH10_05375 [Tannerellaceae bacterium]|nr:hypothetical protein [Tannerellaceae bacterium]
MRYVAKILFCLIGLTMILGVTAQNLTKESIFRWGKKYYSDVKMESRTMFIINGEVYNNEQVDMQLQKEEERGRRISFISYFPSTAAETVVLCTPPYGVWIISTRPDKKKQINSDLKKIKKMSPAFPAVSIDGNLLESKKIEGYLKSLKSKNIYGIQYIKDIPQPEKYGPEGTNGIVIVRTKSEN